jgi:crotonobetainyl-CoA:carnitine CoA-transferase CaiB-like acyl-CoA transferase
MTQADGLLNGVRVLDLSRVLAGPFCCQVLADLGADVVKVERPGLGDDTRQWGPPFLGADGPSAYYLSCNRGKRSVALDLTRPESRDVLDDLLRAADVVVENFRLGSLARLGLDTDRLAKLNPRLVRISISGFGRTGPEAEVPGYDLTIQAMGGLMSITGEQGGPPLKVGVAITDVLTGLYGAVSALAGLYARDKVMGSKSGEAASPAATGFDLALADCTLSALVNVVQSVLVTGQRPGRYGNAHPQIVPYEAFATADGYLVLAIGNDGQWRRFCTAADCGSWAADPRFATNPARVQHREELIPELAGLLAGRSTAQWLSLCAVAEVPCAPVLAVDEVLATPQVAARGMVAELTDTIGRSVPVVASPLHAHGKALCAALAPPELGEHTAEVLRQWLGYDDARIGHLRQQAVVACRPSG